jgi:hypothetical protein
MAGGVEYRDRLPGQLQFGCAVLGHADRLEVAWASFVTRGDEVVILLQSPPKPDGDAFVAVRMYRLPRRRVRFESDFDHFCKSKKERCRLPDRTAVTDETFALLEPPADWTHDARPQSGRRLFHVYRATDLGVIVQFSLRKGAGPDHPMLRDVHANLRFDPEQWIEKAPSVRRESVPKIMTESPGNKAKAPSVRKRRGAASPAAGDRALSPTGSTQSPSWRGHWPTNGSVRDWMIALLRACDAITDPGKSADQAQLPIERLARIGDIDAALSHVDAHLRTLPPSSVLDVVRMARLGAGICLDAGNLEGMEHYLAIAAATEPFNTRKCDRGFSLDAVRKFRAWKGILDPSEAVGDQERTQATFQRADRTFRESLAAGDKTTARSSAEAMARVATEERDEWRRTEYLKRAIVAFADLDDVAAVRRHLELIDADDRARAIKTEVLVRLGMEAEALPRLRVSMRRSLAAAADPSDPNTHIPVGEFVSCLMALSSLGAREEAREWFRQALGERGKWTTPEAGWSSTAIAKSLAEGANALGETVIARQFLVEAMGEAKQERRSAWRIASVKSVLRSPANAGMTQAAIDDARRIRSPKGRRKTLACLLAGAERWEELHEVLDSIDSAEEAADVVWWLHFNLPEAIERGLGH